MIPYKFKGAASALYSADRTWEIIELESGGNSEHSSKVNIGNGIFRAYSARSYLNQLNHCFSHALQV